MEMNFHITYSNSTQFRIRNTRNDRKGCPWLWFTHVFHKATFFTLRAWKTILFEDAFPVSFPSFC